MNFHKMSKEEKKKSSCRVLLQRFSRLKKQSKILLEKRKFKSLLL